MPPFCRHNRFLANCPICSREQAEALAPRRAATPRRAGASATRKPRATRTGSRAGGLRVRTVAREQDDGFRSPLVPGIKASGDAQRLAGELAFATARLRALAEAPAGAYAEVASAADPEEATWLAFLTAHLCPLEAADPFAGVRAAHVPWADGGAPRLDDVPLGPRAAHDPARGEETVRAYRAWAGRIGSQAAAFVGELAWTPERRFARVFERLALPGFHRDARFDLLVTLGQLGVYELAAGSLQLGGAGETTVAAKRVFAIGDTLLLERRAAALAQACEVPLAALDLALWNWARPPARPGLPAPRATLGFPDLAADPATLTRATTALGL